MPAPISLWAPPPIVDFGHLRPPIEADKLPLARVDFAGEVRLPSLLLWIAALAAAAAPQERGALLTNGREIVTAADYPLVALRNDHQGRVEVKLRVDETGLVSACTVIVSSGHSELDAQTCALYQARATFQPAIDASGNAIESDFTQAVNWKLEDSDDSSAPRIAWMTRTTIGFDSTGAVARCTVDFDGVASGSTDCPKAAGAISVESSATPVRYEISEVRFYPGDPDSAPTPPVPDGSTLFGRQVSRIVITPDGQVISCDSTSRTGAAKSQRDQCLMLHDLRFRDGPAETGPSVGTLVHSAYTRGPDGS